MQVEIQPNYIYVKVPYQQKETAKAIGAIEFNQSRKMWKFPNNIYMMRDLIRYFPVLKQNAHFLTYGQKLKARMDQLLQIKKQHDCPGDPRLRPYQRVDVAYLKCLNAAGVFNEQRTGKTPTILTVCKELELSTVLIVCPASLLKNWEREVGIWTTTRGVILKGSKKQRTRLIDSLMKPTNGDNCTVNYLIVSYETLRNDIKSISQVIFDAVILDEAHRLRNKKTKQTQAVFSLNCKRRYALTGTPTVKGGTDIHPILSWLFPEQYTSYWAFVKRYFEVYEDIGGNTAIGKYRPEREQELQELIGFISVQRKRMDKGVMDWLQKPQHIPIPVQMDDKQRRVYQQMLDTFEAVDEEGNAIDSATVLAQLTRLRQICLDPELVKLDAPSAKTDAILDYLDDNPGPVVIMTMFTSYLKKLEKLLVEQDYKVGTIHGEMTNDGKAQAAQDFQAGRTDVLLCNIISAGVGFTLDRADTIIFTDKAWNPSDQQQAEDRIVPVSQDRNHGINIVTFPIADTVDEKIEAILKEKTNLTEVINSGARDAIMKLIGALV